MTKIAYYATSSVTIGGTRILNFAPKHVTAVRLVVELMATLAAILLRPS